MDLTAEEAEELFPSDRGESIENASVEEGMSIERRSYGWTVEINDVPWQLSSLDVGPILDDLGDELDLDRDELSIWSLFIDPDVSADVLDRNT